MKTSLKTILIFGGLLSLGGVPCRFSFAQYYSNSSSNPFSEAYSLFPSEGALKEFDSCLNVRHSYWNLLSVTRQEAQGVDKSTWNKAQVKQDLQEKCTQLAVSLVSQFILKAPEPLVSLTYNNPPRIRTRSSFQNHCTAVRVSARLIARFDDEAPEIKTISSDFVAVCDPRDSDTEAPVRQLASQCRHLLSRSSHNSQVGQDWEILGCTDVLAAERSLATIFPRLDEIQCQIVEQ